MPMVIDPILEIECEAIVQAIDVSSDGKWMAWGGEDGTVRILDMSIQSVLGNLTCRGWNGTDSRHVKFPKTD